jgi:hypothetical protein
MASRYSVDASLLWMKWRTALYHLWLRRAVNLRMKGALRDEWMQLAARCFYGEGAKPVSLPYELIRHQPGLAITWHRESRARARQKLCVAGNALLDDPLFRK